MSRERAGLFVTIDGPGGAGKSTLAAALARHLTGTGAHVHLTREPSPTPLGDMIRAGTGTYRGMALACLVAGDRHQHLASEIRPQMGRGVVVVCDRYLPSSFVLQRIDGLTWETIAALNEGADIPDLAIILSANPAVITARLNQRGGHSRFEAMPGAPAAESELYDDTARKLTEAGWPIWRLDATSRTPAELAVLAAGRVAAIPRPEHA